MLYLNKVAYTLNILRKTNIGLKNFRIGYKNFNTLCLQLSCSKICQSLRDFPFVGKKNPKLRALIGVYGL